jgi:hypothetical protein
LAFYKTEKHNEPLLIMESVSHSEIKNKYLAGNEIVFTAVLTKGVLKITSENKDNDILLSCIPYF